jgi:type I restriction enzyme M protein
VNKLLKQLNQEIAINNPKGRLHKLSHNCIFGTDANPRMARTSKMNMIMHGDGHGGVHHHDGLLNVNGIFENRFDIILTNPPFGARVDKSMKISENDMFNDSEKIEKYVERFGSDYTNALKQVNDNIGKSLIDLFDLGKVSGLTEVLFMERCLRLLKPGGRMGIVLPEGVLNNQNLQKVREYFEDRAKIVLITSIPQDVFVASGATVKPSVVFMKKFTQEESVKFASVKKESEKEINDKYVFEIEKIKKEQLSKKDINKKIKEVESLKTEEIRKLIKEKFDYEIPIAKVEKAGITTTGAKCDNELEDLAKEFREYRKNNKLWNDNIQRFNYVFKGNRMLRGNGIGEEEVFYGE